MAYYTVRFAHLRYPVTYQENEVILRGNVVGVMGSTGQSTGDHLHIDVVRGRVPHMYRLLDIDCGRLEPDFRQLAFFIDEELGGPFRVTTHPYDYRYKMSGGKWKAHPGYDLVFETDPPKIYWNRSMPGEILKRGFDQGYGNFVQIGFQT